MAEKMPGRIQLFAKAPIPGMSKSRLIPALGAEGAAMLQAQFISHTLASLSLLPVPAELWCAPDTHHPAFLAAARDYSVSLHTQVDGDLGRRMHHALECGISRGSPVVLIGTDCPTLNTDDLHEAFDALHRGQDAVLGPSIDGGYYLIGLRKPQPSLFSDIPWSTSGVLNETRARLHSLGLQRHELRTQRDIDTPADLAHLPLSLTQTIAL